MYTRWVGMLTSVMLSLLVCAAAFGQGMYWESTTTGGRQGDKARISKTYYMPKLFKTDGEDEGISVILMLEKGMMYTINANKKTYSEITVAEMEEVMKGAGAAMDDATAEMEQQMAEMSEQERELMKKMMGDRMPGMKKDSKVDVTATGEKRTISGYTCSEYVVKRDGKTMMTVWATKDVKGPDAMRNDLEEFSRLMASMNPMMPKNLVQAMKGIKGFPIETLFKDSTKEVVTNIEKRSIAASEFEVPEGYEKVESDLK